MRTFRQYVSRQELSLELALALAAALLFREIRPSIDIGCGTAVTALADEGLEFIRQWKVAFVLPVAVAVVECKYAIRPWLKRAVRLGVGASAVATLGAYAIVLATFLPRG